jgi:hypothetical protein
MRGEAIMAAELSKLKQSATEMANANNEEMQGMSKREAMQLVKKILADNEIVFGVWQDLNEPDGVDMIVVKGTSKLREAIMHNIAISVKTSAIKCLCYEQALALQQKFGDRPDA